MRRRFRTPLLLWVVFLYVLLIPAVGSVYLSDSLRIALANGRIYALPVIGALLFVRGISSRRTANRWWRSGVHRTCFLLGLGLPIFFALGAVLKPEFRATTFALYVVWAFMAFAVWPLTMRSAVVVDRWVKLLLAANAIAWLVPAFYWTFVGRVVTQFQLLASYGYNNPDLFAQCPQVVFACLLFFDPKSRRGLWLRRVALAICVLTAARAEARNVLLFQGIMFSLLVAFRRSRRPGAVVLATAVLSLLVALFGSQYVDRDRIDDLSSGRLTVWKNNLDAVFVSTDDLKGTLIGPDKIPQQRGQHGYDKLKKKKAFHKFHVDNAFLEVIIEAGVIGLLLFLAPYLLAVRMALIRIRRTGSRRDKWALAVVLGIAAQSMFISSIPSFANPLSFLFLTALAITLGLFGETAGDTNASDGAEDAPSSAGK